MSRDEPEGTGGFSNDLVHRLNPLTIAALVLLVLTVILIGIATSLPWWASFRNGTMTTWYLGDECANTSCQTYQAYPTLRDTFGLTSAFVEMALILYLLELALFFLSLFWARAGAVALLFGIMGSLFLLAAPIYLYLALPGAVTSSGLVVPIDGFFGSYTQKNLLGNVQYSWTGGAGWFMTWGVFVFSLLATAVTYLAARRLLRGERVTRGDNAVATRSLRESSRADAPSVNWREAKFCPVCGARYPAGTPYCSKDATPLKDTS